MAINKAYEKLKRENTVRMLCYKHRGDLTRIMEGMAEEFPGEEETLDLTYVKRILKKFNKEIKKNDPHLATMSFELILEGTRQRQLEWDEDAEHLDRALYTHKSFCCNKIAVQMLQSEELVYVCTSCNEACQTRQEMNLKIMQERRQHRIAKRDDDVNLAIVVEKLGFGKQNGPTLKQTNMQAVLQAPHGGGSLPASTNEPPPRKRIDSKDVSDEGKDVTMNINELDPMDREVFVGQLRQKMDDIIEGEKVDDKVKQVEQEDSGTKSV